jgi:hypothetical protein
MGWPLSCCLAAVAIGEGELGLLLEVADMAAALQHGQIVAAAASAALAWVCPGCTACAARGLFCLGAGSSPGMWGGE